jgi:hypothetical protein
MIGRLQMTREEIIESLDITIEAMRIQNPNFCNWVIDLIKDLDYIDQQLISQGVQTHLDDCINYRTCKRVICEVGY